MDRASGDFKKIMKSAEEVFPDDHSLVQAFDSDVGTKHLSFPARETAIKTAISQNFWFEPKPVPMPEPEPEPKAEAETESDGSDNVQDDIDTLKFNTKTMTGYGHTIPEVMRSLFPILEGFDESIMKTGEEQHAAIATFLDGGTSLWNLIHLEITKEEEAAGRGLAAMQKAVWYAVGDKRMPMEKRMDIVRLHTIWFITAWLKMQGDLKAIKEQALKELPNGDDDLMRIMAKDRGYVKSLLYPERATVPTVSNNPQGHGSVSMSRAATTKLPTTIPQSPTTVPKKAAKVRQTLEIPPPVPPYTVPVRKRSQTLLTMPKTAVEIDRLLGVPATSYATQVKKVVEAKAVEVTHGTTIATPQKAVLMNVMAEPKFEMPEVKGKGEAEEQDFDVSHESMVRFRQ